MKTYPAFSKISAARTTLLFDGLKAQTILIVVVTVRTIQKSKNRSDRMNLWPRLEFKLYIVMCVAAPIRKRTKKTAVIGTSSFTVGMPPKMASGGAKGPRPTRFMVSICAAMRVGDEEARAAAAVAPPLADWSDEVRLPAEVSIELDDFPAARPFGSDACTGTLDDDEIACADTAGVMVAVATGVGSVKIVVVIIEVVTDIIGGSVFAKGTAEATAGGRVSIDIAVTVRVLGGTIDVSLKVEVTPVAARVACPAASVDVCEPISRYLQDLKISSREFRAGLDNIKE